MTLTRAAEIEQLPLVWNRVVSGHQGTFEVSADGHFGRVTRRVYDDSWVSYWEVSSEDEAARQAREHHARVLAEGLAFAVTHGWEPGKSAFGEGSRLVSALFERNDGLTPDQAHARAQAIAVWARKKAWVATLKEIAAVGVATPEQMTLLHGLSFQLFRNLEQEFFSDQLAIRPLTDWVYHQMPTPDVATFRAVAAFEARGSANPDRTIKMPWRGCDLWEWLGALRTSDSSLQARIASHRADLLRKECVVKAKDARPLLEEAKLTEWDSLRLRAFREDFPVEVAKLPKKLQEALKRVGG